MDSCLIAAAAAAGYFVKYWQNLTRDRNEFNEFSSVDSRIGKGEVGKGPFCKLASRRKLQEDVSSDGRDISDRKFYGLNVASATEMESTSGFDGEVGSVGNRTDGNLVYQSSLAPEFLKTENQKEDNYVKGPGAGSGSTSAKPSITRMDSFNEPARKICSLRTKYSYGHLLRPVSSLDSCLMAQLYMQHVKMEEYILSSLPSPAAPMMRPLLITDGNRVISRSSGEFSYGSNGTVDCKLHNQATSGKSGDVFGIPPLPKTKSSYLPELKFKKGNRCVERLSIPCKMATEKQFHSQLGPHDEAVLFCLGITIGVISSYLENQKEGEKLRGLLKQTENLVQDLQEELEMKDSMTVKELVNENNEPREIYDNSFHDRATNLSSVEQNLDNSTRYDGKESYHEKIEESSEPMSKIEAELEAELERLGLNMNLSNVGRRMSNLVELDQDFAADFADGELRSDMVSGQALSQPLQNEDRSGTSTTHSGNYAVSPRELSLRLHEVIQSRLEEHIQELETALQNSQRKVRQMEYEHKNSSKIPNMGTKYSTDLVSPVGNEFDGRSKPLVMKLSGEALDAYNEACEELLRVYDSEEEDASDIYQNNYQEDLCELDGNMSWGSQNGANGSLLDSTHCEHNITEEPLCGYTRTKILEKQLSRVQELLDIGVSEDECSECDDEMEKQLIQQIVEKTKKGSPLLLNAQRLLFSMDEF